MENQMNLTTILEEYRQSIEEAKKIADEVNKTIESLTTAKNELQGKKINLRATHLKCLLENATTVVKQLILDETILKEITEHCPVSDSSSFLGSKYGHTRYYIIFTSPIEEPKRTPEHNMERRIGGPRYNKSLCIKLSVHVSEDSKIDWERLEVKISHRSIELNTGTDYWQDLQDIEQVQILEALLYLQTVKTALYLIAKTLYENR